MKTKSSKKYTCDYCNNDISLLTIKLQQHSTSQLWLKHGQCCAACTTTKDITGIHKEVTVREDHDKSYLKRISRNGDHNTNIFFALTRAAKIEDASKLKSKKWAQRLITTGKIIASVGLAACLIFLYYEFFIIALIGLIVCITGIVTCRLGVWGKCRTR